MKNKSIYLILIFGLICISIFSYQCGGNDNSIDNTNPITSSALTNISTSNQTSSSVSTTTTTTSTETTTTTETSTTTTGNTIPFTVQLTNSTAVAIPDNLTGTVTSNLVCPTNIILTDVNFWIRTNHAYVGDLRLFLQTPNATIVQLIAVNTITCDYSTSGYPSHFFDDEGTVSIDSSTPDDWRNLLYMIPNQPLSGFDGLSGSGTWVITCYDTDIGAVGSILGWGLDITGY